MRFNASDGRRSPRSSNMISLKWLVAAICLANASALQDELGPQHFRQSTPSPIKLKPGYVMKDVILYLTPSQIKTLEATQGLNKVVPLRKANENAKVNFSNDELQKLEAELKKQLEHHNIFEEHNSSPVEKRPPTPIVEPNTEKPIPFSPQYIQQQVPQSKPQQELNYFLPNVQQSSNVKLPESYSYIKFFTAQETQQKPNIPFLYPHPHVLRNSEEQLKQNLELQRDPLHRQQYKWIPYEYTTKKTPEQYKQRVIVQAPQWPKHLDQVFSEPSENQQFSKLVSANTKESGEKELQLQKELSDIKFAAQFKDHKEQSDYQKFLTKIEKDNAFSKAEALKNSAPFLLKEEETITKQNSENSESRYAAQLEKQKQASDYQRFVSNIEKENALAKAEALRDSASIVVKQEETVTRGKPAPLIKHANIPVVQPFFVPVPHLAEVKPYRIGILQAVPIAKTEKFEVERPKDLLKVNRPYVVHRFLPLELNRE